MKHFKIHSFIMQIIPSADGKIGSLPVQTTSLSVERHGMLWLD